MLFNKILPFRDNEHLTGEQNLKISGRHNWPSHFMPIIYLTHVGISAEHNTHCLLLLDQPQ